MTATAEQKRNAAGVPLWHIENLTTLEHTVVAAPTDTDARRAYEDQLDPGGLDDGETLDGNVLIAPLHPDSDMDEGQVWS